MSRAVGGGLRRILPVLALAVALASVALVARTGWRWAHRTPRFALQTIVVTGNQHVTAERVIARADVPMGTNLFALSPDAIEARVRGDAWITEARVSRRLPHTLEIAVTERAPTAVLLAGGAYLTGDDGHPFKRARLETGEADGLPVITGLERAFVSNHRDEAATLVRHALRILEAWRSVAGRPAVAEIHLGTDGVTLYTRDGAAGVRLGRTTATEIPSRLAAFDAIWDALGPEERARARTIHLYSPVRPDRVTVQLADSR